MYHDARRRARLWAIAAAVLLAAAVVLAARDAMLMVQLGNVPREWHVASTSPDLDAAGTLLYMPSQGRALLVIERLPPAPAGQTYQVWLTSGGTAVPVGELRPASDQNATVLFHQQPAAYQAVAVTIESGKVPAPTGKPVLLGQIGS